MPKQNGLRPPCLSPQLQRLLPRIPWKLGVFEASSVGIYRASTHVLGEPLWFESSDHSLAPRPEAFGSALLLAAAAQKRRLMFASPADSQWLDNVRVILARAAKWWKYPNPIPVPAEANPPPQAGGADTAAPAILCFSGGVDSFYTLLRGGRRIGLIVFVHGYDMPLEDKRRAAVAEASLHAIAAELGIQSSVIRTNLRSHRALRNTNWEHIHGGALAAIGHLLGDHANRLLISASYPRAFDRPWGSRWDLDHWWSSSRLEVDHAGAERWRAEKLADMLDEPLVRKHLRVCWENRTDEGNCGSCEKCLRTMLILEGHGRLEAFKVFPNAAALATCLSRLPGLHADLIPVYTSFLNSGLTDAVRSALSDLIQRSQEKLRSISDPNI